MSDENVIVCHHCGNRVPLTFVAVHRGRKLYEHIDNKRYDEDFDISIYKCPTCGGLSVFCDYSRYPRYKSLAEQRVYPAGERLLPEDHKVASTDCIPQSIRTLYEEIAPLRHIAPHAFVGQIRRALEFICKEQKAEGRTLSEQLQHLISKGAFPGHFADVTNLMRAVGNIGAHANDTDLDYWDAELLNDFFRIVVEYIYVTPSRIQRMRQRLGKGDNA